MLTSSDFLDILKNDFIFANHRLENHPFVKLYIFLNDENPILKEVSNGWFLSAPVPTMLNEDIFQNPDLQFFNVWSRAMKSVYWDKPEHIFFFQINDGKNVLGLLLMYSEKKQTFKQYHGMSYLFATLLTYAHNYFDSRIKVVSPVSIQLGSALKTIREELDLTQFKLAKKLNRNRITISRWEAGSQFPSPSQLIDWCTALGLFDKSNTQVHFLDISKQINEVLKDNPAYLSSISPEQFEIFIAERLSKMGYEVIRTGSTFQKDGGIDLVAYPKNSPLASFLIAVQIKHHKGSRKSGSKDVRDLLSHKGSEFRFGLLITNTTFTKDAKWLASQESHKDFIRLRDFEDLKKWIQDNFKTENYWNEIPDEITLAPGIIIKIPKPIISNAKEIWKDSGYKT